MKLVIDVELFEKLPESVLHELKTVCARPDCDYEDDSFVLIGEEADYYYTVNLESETLEIKKIENIVWEVSDYD